MVKNIRKSIAVVAVVAMLVLTTMTATVSAAVTSTTSYWSVSSTYPVYGGVVYGLVHGTDSGVSVHCTAITENGTARVTLNDSRLSLYGDGVDLTYVGDYGTIYFVNNWTDYSNGDVAYTATLTSNFGSVSGYAL